MDTPPPRPSRASETPSQDPLDAAKQNGLDVDTSRPAIDPVVPSTDLSIAQSRISEKKSHRVLIVVVIMTIVVIALLGAAYYYFFSH